MHFKLICILDIAVLLTISVVQGLSTLLDSSTTSQLEHLILYVHFFHFRDIKSQPRTDFCITLPSQMNSYLRTLSSVQGIKVSSDPTAEKHTDIS